MRREAGRLIPTLAIALVGVVVALGALAWWILESSGVAIVVTRDPDGSPRETHVWYATSEGTLWLEAGRPDHPWYLDIQKDPRIELRAPGVSGTYDAATVPGRKAHDFVRGLLREKYGLRDELLGYAIDTSRSIAVRLVPVGAEADHRGG